MKVTFLGTGGSAGTPGVFMGWGACDPENPRNRRLRPSILVEEGETRVLVDTSPDLREQCLRAGISRLDAVVYTHAHADHLHGIDDLRAINRHMDAPLDTYADGHTLALIGQRFGYVFEPLAPGAPFYYKPTLVPHEIHDGQRFAIGALEIVAFDQDHGYSRSMGLRINGLGYCTDVVRMSAAAFDILAGVDTLIVGTLREEPHDTHAHVDLAVDWIDRVGARRGYLTHLGLALDHDRLAARLPDHVRPAHDGLEIEVISA